MISVILTKRYPSDGRLSQSQQLTRVAGQIQHKYHQIQLEHSLNNSLMYATPIILYTPYISEKSLLSSSHAKSSLKMKAADRISTKNVP